ncbi:hypothetical protein FACS1894211_08820 [Clostridia bacterium]|nr:hypothetical protein FACS1894211_08820 [Clostridia bacterium]
MANINELKKYLDCEFSSGPYAGQDYLTFQTKYVNYLRGLCKSSGWELAKVGRNHYCFSAFIKDGRGKYVYLSVSDVRFNNGWYNNILIRTAAGDRDYTGGRNTYTTLPGIRDAVTRLLAGGAVS